MSLGLSQIGSQMSAGQDQNHGPADILRLGSSSRSGQFENFIGQSMGSAFRPSQTMASSAYFLPESDQDYRQENHSPHGLLGNKPLHGLMQLADLQNNSSSSAGSSIFNLSFFPSSSNTSNIDNNNNGNNPSNISSSLLLQNPFNNGSGSSNEGSNLFSDNLVGEHLTSAIPSLYSASVQNPNITPHLSATALLQKAAQLGSATNNTRASLLNTFGSSSSSNAKSDHNPHFVSIFGHHDHHNNNGNNQHQNHSHIHDLMTSITGSSSSSIFGPGLTFAPPPQENDYGYSATKLNFGDESPLKHRSTSFSSYENAKLQHNIRGGHEGLTRDFLGVGPAGELVRSMSNGGGGGGGGSAGGFGELRSLESERKSAAPKSPSFGGGVNFQ